MGQRPRARCRPTRVGREPRDRHRGGADAMNDVMKAAVFVGPERPLHIEQRPVPRAEPGEIVLRVAYCGICGSDLHATEPSAAPLEAGTVLGHEISGVVTQSGSEAI